MSIIIILAILALLFGAAIFGLFSIIGSVLSAIGSFLIALVTSPVVLVIVLAVVGVYVYDRYFRQ